jgi:hypothetical protein
VGVVLVTNGDGFPRAAAVVAKKAEVQLDRMDFALLAGIRQNHSAGAMGRIGVRVADLIALGYPWPKQHHHKPAISAPRLTPASPHPAMSSVLLIAAFVPE